MRPEKEFNAGILKLALTIQEKFPELSKYLKKMPDTSTGKLSPEITSKHIQDYYDSVNSLLNQYKVARENKIK